MGNRQQNHRQEFQEIKNQACQEQSEYIRKVLVSHIKETQQQYNKTTGDHRYCQGALHALEGFLEDITRES